MSSKKDLRRKRREQEREQKQARKLNPALIFIVGIALTLALVIGVYVLFGGPGGPGDPPWPGAVWSSAHGHWH